MMNTVIPTEVEHHQDTKNQLLKKSIHKTRLKIKKKKERNESPIAHHRHLAERRKSGAISKSVA